MKEQDTPTHPAILLANDRPSCSFEGSEDTLMEWAIDAEDMLRKLVEQNNELLETLTDILPELESIGLINTFDKVIDAIAEAKKGH